MWLCVRMGSCVGTLCKSRSVMQRQGRRIEERLLGIMDGISSGAIGRNNEGEHKSWLTVLAFHMQCNAQI